MDHTRDLEVEKARGLGGDLASVWRWILYRSMTSRVQASSTARFAVQSDDWKQFVSLFDCVDAATPVRSLVPTIESGEIEVDLKVAKVALRGRPAERQSLQKVPFQNLLAAADAQFAKLRPTYQSLNIYVDELEFDPSNQDRDARLIAALLQAADQVNERSADQSLKVRIYVAIRTEVLSAMSRQGLEINKLVDDFGVEIRWAKEGSATTHPLLQILNTRVNQARMALGLPRLPAREAWRSVFPEYLFGQHSTKYILHRTWYRPRDIVRLISIAQQKHPGAPRFSENVARGIESDYSTASWNELEEELSASFAPEQLRALVLLLNGFNTRFYLDQFEHRYRKFTIDYELSDSLAFDLAATEVVGRLYDVGAVGNVWAAKKGVQHQSFAFRGDLDPQFDAEFIFHPALRRRFSLRKHRKPKKPQSPPPRKKRL